MAEDWAKTIAKKVEGRITEEAERASTLQRRFVEGVERFRKIVLDLVTSVNTNIPVETSRIQIIILDNGLILAAAYKRIVTEEKMERVEGVPACVGKVTLHREDRKAAVPPDTLEVYLTSAGTQTAYYHRIGKDVKIFTDPEFKQIVEYFAS
jgi:hypothetical protein